MSYVTQEQAKVLKELGYPQSIDEDTYVFSHHVSSNGVETSRTEWVAPSVEELMEWLKVNIPHRPSLVIANLEGTKWKVGDFGCAAFENHSLIDALYSCACWVLEGKK